jgi:hypothetical protein
MTPQAESPLVAAARARVSQAHAHLIDAVVNLPSVLGDSRMVTPEVGAALEDLQRAKRALDVLEIRPNPAPARGATGAQGS